MSKLYWAASDAAEAVTECEKRRVDYYRYLNDQGFMYAWNAIYQAYYAGKEHCSPLMTGEQGNIMSVSVNDFRNLIQHKVAIVINQNPAWEPMAVNSDVKSTAQCKLAKSLLNYYQDVKRARVKATNAVTNAALFGEGYLLQTWDATAGARKFTLPTENGVRNINEGDVDQRIFEPIDVIRDVTITDSEQNHWYIVRETRNKYDTAVKYPELYDEIVNSTVNRDPGQHYLNYVDWMHSKDLVTVYTFLHKRTAACPEGRVLRYINDAIILSDGPLAMQDYPLHRLVDTEIRGKNFGYSDAYDMLGLQDTLNGLWSTVFTNLNAFGVQNVIMPVGSNISESSFGGLNIIEWDPQSGGAPQALQLTSQPDGIWNAINGMSSKLETISGVNSTARGNPPAQVGSGVALSMMQSLNVQYNQGLQSSYVSFMEAIGTALINLIKDYAHLPRVAAIVGESNSSYLKEYKGADLMNVNRVVAKLANPMSNTIQGRYAMGEMLASKGLIKDASQLLTVLETGNLDNLTDGRNSQLIYAKAIVEALRNGEPVPMPRITDDHLLHIRMISDLASDINIRTERPDLLEAMDNQILAHMKFLQDPSVSMLMVALQQQPLPPNQPQAQGQGPQGRGPGANISMKGPNISLNTNAAAQAATAQGTPSPGMLATGEPSAPTGQLPQDFASDIEGAQ